MDERGEGGAVTAEAAVVIPVLVMVAIALTWLVAYGVAQVRATDAARETARALARGDDRAAALELGRRVAPDGAEIGARTDDGEVVVSVRVPVPGPGGVLGLFGEHLVEGEAVAALERSATEAGPETQP